MITPFAEAITLQSYPLSSFLASVGGFLSYITFLATILAIIHTKMFERSLRNNMMKEDIMKAQGRDINGNPLPPKPPKQNTRNKVIQVPEIERINESEDGSFIDQEENKEDESLSNNNLGN
jgi:hypothetical protein